MRFKKLGSYPRRPRAKFFAIISICFSGLVSMGEPPMNWDAQIRAIERLAANGYLGDAEEAGKVLFDGIGDEQLHLLDLLGEICIKSDRYRQAADYYLQAEKKAGDSLGANRYLVLAGDAYYQNKDYELAAVIYLERYRREADDEILFRYGNALLHGDILDQFGKLKFQSERIRAKFDWNCAVYAYKKNNLREACRHLESCLEGSHLGLSAYYFYAQMQYRLGKIDGARKIIERGKYTYKWTDDAYYEKLSRLQLRIAIEQGNEKTANDLEAELRARKSTGESGDLGMLLLWKAIGLRRSGKSGEALKVLEELEHYFPDEAKYLEGEIYGDDCYGRAGDALKLFEELGKKKGRIAHMGKLRRGDMECLLGNFSQGQVIYEELQRELEKEEWIKQKEELMDYLASKISRSKLAQGSRGGH
jgi:tetratricopeptide (TPR) repeat protein